MAGNEKKLYKQLSHQEQGQGSNLLALSPPQPFVGSPVVPVSSPLSLTGAPPVYIRTASGNGSHGAGESSVPQLCDTISSKTLFYLRSTLNASFQPDYDFTNAKSEDFSRVPSVKWVMDGVRANLCAVAGEMFTAIETNLWASIDQEIGLSECDIYR